MHRLTPSLSTRIQRQIPQRSPAHNVLPPLWVPRCTCTPDQDTIVVGEGQGPQAVGRGVVIWRIEEGDLDLLPIRRWKLNPTSEGEGGGHVPTFHHQLGSNGGTAPRRCRCLQIKYRWKCTPAFFSLFWAGRSRQRASRGRRTPSPSSGALAETGNEE